MTYIFIFPPSTRMQYRCNSFFMLAFQLRLCSSEKSYSDWYLSRMRGTVKSRVTHSKSTVPQLKTKLIQLQNNNKRFFCGATKGANQFHLEFETHQILVLSQVLTCFPAAVLWCFFFFNTEPIKLSVISMWCHILLDALLVFQPPALLRIYDLLCWKNTVYVSSYLLVENFVI